MIDLRTGCLRHDKRVGGYCNKTSLMMKITSRFVILSVAKDLLGLSLRDDSLLQLLRRFQTLCYIIPIDNIK
jgi:hypothetical protein